MRYSITATACTRTRSTRRSPLRRRSRCAGPYAPRAYYDADEELRAAIDAIASGTFAGPGNDAVVGDLLGHDEYLTMADYRAYVDCQDAVARAWRDEERWTRASVLNAARSGFFSSDRTIRDYCRDIWRVEPVSVPEMG